MIPKFPEFKKLELSDREEVEAFTSKYPPYSDFNFTSLWSWTLDSDAMICMLNENFVIRFRDYLTGAPFLMFLGEKLVNDTTDALIDYSIETIQMPSLQLIPHCVTQMLDTSRFAFEDDRDNSDYIISVQRIRTYDGRDYAHKRREVSRFTRLHDQFDFRTLDLTDKDVEKAIYGLFSMWLSGKGSGRTLDEEREFLAFQRFLESPLKREILATGIYINDVIGAFWLLEDLHNGYSISHFEKADTEKFPGIFAYLKKQTAGLLDDRNVRFINLEQDLGIPGLRQSKLSYFPEDQLNKYCVTRRSHSTIAKV